MERAVEECRRLAFGVALSELEKIAQANAATPSLTQANAPRYKQLAQQLCALGPTSSLPTSSFSRTARRRRPIVIDGARKPPLDIVEMALAERVCPLRQAEEFVGQLFIHPCDGNCPLRTPVQK